MKRKEFLKELKSELNKRRDIETEEVLFYYDELIQDAIDNGESEEIFVANLGSVMEIVRRMEDDEEFVETVKQKNSDVVRDVIGLTVKTIGYTIFGIIAFVIAVTSFSLLVSGISVIGGAIFRVVLTGPYDLYGYLAFAGLALLGIAIAVFAVALFKWFFKQANPFLLSIFRKTKVLFNRKED